MLKNGFAFPAILSVLSLLVIVVTGCQKQVADSYTTSVSDALMIEREDNNVMNAIQSVLRDSGTYRVNPFSLIPACAAVTIPDSALQTTKTLVIDFGTSGCANTTWDGKTRTGKITATWTGNYFKTGTIITIATSNYVVGGYAFNINQALYCVGPDANNNLVYSIASKDSISSSGTRTTWNVSRTRTWINNGTITAQDDTFIVKNATGLGMDRTGTAFNYAISDSILFVQSCLGKKLVSGDVTMNVQGKAQRIINIGNGNCVYPIQINIAGNYYTITLN